MAEQIHLQIFRDGAKRWNEWRSSNPSIIPDLRYIEPSLGQKQYGPINGGPINLRGALLFKADLRNATLIEADLRNAELVEAELGGARLENADLTQAKLVDASLIGADLASARLDGADLTGADLTGARNLSQMQVNAARGDITTQLPFDLVMPRSWIAPQATAQTPPYGDDFLDETGDEQDLYAILGAKKSDSDETIHAIYRVRAKSLHPDLNPAPRAEVAFRRLTHAYAILRDPARRKRYDMGEIGADGEETEAYRYAIWRTARARQVRNYVAMSALVMFSLLGLVISQVMGLQPWRKQPLQSPSPTVTANAPQKPMELDMSRSPGKAKTQLRMEDEPKPLPLPVLKPADAGANVESAPPQDSAETPGASDAIVAADQQVAAVDPTLTSGTPQPPIEETSPKVEEAAVSPEIVQLPQAEQKQVEEMSRILLTPLQASTAGPRLNQALAPSPFAKAKTASSFSMFKPAPQALAATSPRLAPCRPLAMPTIASFRWIDKFRVDERDCKPARFTPLDKPAQKRSPKLEPPQLKSPIQVDGAANMTPAPITPPKKPRDISSDVLSGGL